MMQLTRFYVRKFRSVDDSGWIETDKAATLIGVNEAGKSNLLLALWKLNPTGEGAINLLTDLPRELYSTLRDSPRKPDFIEAEFDLDERQAEHVAALTGLTSLEVSKVNIKRNYDGNIRVVFPEAEAIKFVATEQVKQILEQALSGVQKSEERGKGEKGIKERAVNTLVEALELLSNSETGLPTIEKLILKLKNIDSVLKSSEIVPIVKGSLKELAALSEKLQSPHPNDHKDTQKYVISEIPVFVYYSTYGNLDSEIYLPHVIENLKREDQLTGRIAAQTRTLRVLFDFVGLEPQEILDKGKEPRGRLNQQGQEIEPPTAQQIADAAEAKRERDVLLDSASTRLTREFRKWWQGNYIFDLAADGNQFRIWVSDEERPSKIELENRSTGLQWFLSFFLVFLVESEEAHKGAILLLDEAGLSLHALAQKDLITFFERLAESNQLIHTTHSPFLVDTDHIDRVKVVYVDGQGYTVASSDLRSGEDDPRQSRSIYAVHAAVGLSVSEAMLQGCHPVIVEGQSDQYYLSAIKLNLIRRGLLNPERELVFPPSGGVRGVTSVAAVIAAKDEELPYVLLDSDDSGQDFKRKLLSGQYQGLENRIIEIGDIIELQNSEVEDLIPFSLMRPALTKLFRDVEDVFFEDIYQNEQPIVPQIEEFANQHKVRLNKGWKVDVARQVKGRILQSKQDSIDNATITRWQRLFEKIYPVVA